MRIMDSQIIKSKIRGSFLGALIGDCCGAPYEGEPSTEGGAKLVLEKYFDKLEGPMFRAPKKPYTDDTAMTKSVAQTLIKHRSIDQKDLATSFVKEYFRDPRRGYGEAVGSVFHKLRKNKIEDPLGPARDQFNGTGSYGNGGAMRIAPVALFCYKKDTKTVIEMARQSAEITHAHAHGINGTIFQALAIHSAFQQSPDTPIDIQQFLKDLQTKISSIENQDDEGLGIENPTPYTTQLKQVLKFISKKDNPSEAEIINVLGNEVSALFSVPTALYCFLRSQKDENENTTIHPFRQAIQYAISLGGDTDTIASMTGAISGAYYGDSVISKNLIEHCENSEEILELADSLYEASLAE